jgi:integrase
MRAMPLEFLGSAGPRHGFATALIVEERLDPVVVSRQLGHASPSITLDTYSHVFDQARNADELREGIGSSSLAAVADVSAVLSESPAPA